MSIDVRTPFLIIHSVKNAVQLAGPSAEQSFKSLAQFGRLNLPTVSRADCGERIGENQARLQRAGLTVELYAGFGAKYGFGQADSWQNPGIEESRERKVMNRKHCSQPGDCLVAGINRLQIGGNQPGHPIIQVNDIKALSE